MRTTAVRPTAMPYGASQIGVTHVINTGIAGSLDASIDIGDLVVSTDTVRHDVDASVFGYAPGQVPDLDILIRCHCGAYARRLSLALTGGGTPPVVSPAAVPLRRGPAEIGRMCYDDLRLAVSENGPFVADCLGGGAAGSWTGFPGPGVDAPPGPGGSPRRRSAGCRGGPPGARRGPGSPRRPVQLRAAQALPRAGEAGPSPLTRR